MEAVNEKIKEIIAEYLALHPAKLGEDGADKLDLIEDLNADSLDCVELIMAFEEEFDLEITDEDAEKVKTVGDALTYLSGRVSDN